MPLASSSASSIPASVFADLQPRIDRALARGERLVRFQIGDTYLPPPEVARYARHAGDDEDVDVYRYGPIAGLALLREAVARASRARGGELAACDASNVLPTSGATHAVHAGLRAILEPRDEVLVPTPFWPLVPGIVAAVGAVPVEVELSSLLYADPTRSPRDVLAAALTPKTRAIYLITPNNPDGYVLSKEQLEAIASLVIERDLWVLSDEVYADFAYERPHVSLAALPGMAERTLTVSSFSKSHGLAGARVGALVAPAAIIELARRVSTHTIYAVSVPMQRAALAALREGQGWIESARAAYVQARDRAHGALTSAGIGAHQAHGGSYLFLDFASVLSGRPLTELLAHAVDHGVLLAPGTAFGVAHAERARLCFTAVSPAELDEGLERLRAAIASF